MLRHHQHGEMRPQEPLSIAVRYEANKPRIGDTVGATATVANRMAEAAPMVMVELPIPAGFTLEAADFARLVQAGTIAKYQVRPTRVLVYLRELSAGKSLTVPYRLRAQMAADIHVPPARAYEYYNPARQGFSASQRLLVSARH